jgi:hypothetical protein
MLNFLRKLLGQPAQGYHVALRGTVRAYSGMRGSLTTRLIPADQKRGWKQKYHEAERELQELLAPKTSARSASAVTAAQHKLHAFYVQTYHIKDALIADAASTGRSGKTVENAITSDPTLALLADLANLDKHDHLTKPPRSGGVPVIESVGGTSGHDSQPETWRLDMVIKHNGKTLDGLHVAEDAVIAWRKLLTGWGLI